MGQPKKSQSDAQLLREKIKDVRIAMLTTTELDGSLHSRPMLTEDAEDFNGELWFLTQASAHKVQEVDKNHQVNLSYARAGDNLFISVSGNAELVRDSKKIKELWKPTYKTWFPNGQDDPDLALLKVRVERAEYWDTVGGKTGVLYSVLQKLGASSQDAAGIDVRLNMQH